eukprot:scaffold5463_cov155-Skeletonema_marinoi.AAC.5
MEQYGHDEAAASCAEKQPAAATSVPSTLTNINWKRQIDDDDRAAYTTKTYQATPTAEAVTAAAPDEDSDEE